MKTYQDLLEVGDSEQSRMEFVRGAISDHKASQEYRIAEIADEYDRHQNRTIVNYQKLLYTMAGNAVPDNYSANYKIPSRFFNRFVVQQVQYLLGNGVTWGENKTAETLGEDFDMRLQEIAKQSLIGGVAFGFFNLDHVEVFSLLEFVPLYDEENGALMAGVRFWQIDSSKPLRATLYEIDGYTDYMWRDGEGSTLNEKRSYVQKVEITPVDGETIYDGENYPSFPIVPMWGNPHHQSEIIGIREGIDAYDLIKSGFANDLDDASQIYWTIQNAGGMDDIDLARFVERMHTVKAAVVDDQGSTAEAHTLEVPYNARETVLDRLEKDLYRDYMALNTETIASGATTATQIRAAYEPLNNKADQFEACVHDFLQGILSVAGIEDEASFTRSLIVNAQEEIQTVIQAAMFLSEDYVTRKILTLLGDGDMYEDVAEEKGISDYNRLTRGKETSDGGRRDEGNRQNNGGPEEENNEGV